MQIYLVGGAVRDELMGLGDSDKDWVVVGSTPEDLIFEGYTPVGKDFPVFLHPSTGEEYALARTERKTAPGYHGFVFHSDPSITLEQDLARRDLTINAIAKDSSGSIIDPFHGQEDIANKIFRHVSPAFKEDPVRILRLARFAARFTDFTVAPETMSLMRRMCEEGEVNALVAERVWQEFSKGLCSQDPFKMVEMLWQCGALQKLCPSLVSDLSEHMNALERSLRQACLINAPLSVRFALVDFFLSIGVDLKATKECSDLAELLKARYGQLETAKTLSAEEIFNLLQSCDAFRRPQRFEELLVCCDCMNSNLQTLSVQKNVQAKDLSVKDFLLSILSAAQQVDHKAVALEAMKGGMKAEQIGAALEVARTQAIALALKTPSK